MCSPVTWYVPLPSGRTRTRTSSPGATLTVYAPSAIGSGRRAGMGPWPPWRSGCSSPSGAAIALNVVPGRFARRSWSTVARPAVRMTTYSRMPNRTTVPHTTSAPNNAIRARIDRATRLLLQDVADAADGLDQARLAELGAQVADVHV